MTETPAPLTPPDCDLRSYRFMALDVVRVLDSDTFTLSTGDEFKAAFSLWAKAWHQVPAGSLTDDDRVLARFVGVSVTEWRALRERALSGFIKCSDGRLYHPVVCEKAREAWVTKNAQIARTEAARAARAAKLAERKNVSQDTEPDATEPDPSLSQSEKASKGEDRIEKEESSESARAIFDPKRWFDAIAAAAGPGMLDPTKTPRLRTEALSEFRLWFNAGADPDLDAAPVVAALTATARPADPIAAWAFFRRAVLKHHAERTRDLTAETAAATKASADDTNRRPESAADRNGRELSEAAQRARDAALAMESRGPASG